MLFFSYLIVIDTYTIVATCNVLQLNFFFQLCPKFRWGLITSSLLYHLCVCIFVQKSFRLRALDIHTHFGAGELRMLRFSGWKPSVNRPSARSSPGPLPRASALFPHARGSKLAITGFCLWSVSTTAALISLFCSCAHRKSPKHLTHRHDVQYLEVFFIGRRSFPVHH